MTALSPRNAKTGFDKIELVDLRLVIEAVPLQMGKSFDQMQANNSGRASVIGPLVSDQAFLIFPMVAKEKDLLMKILLTE